MGLFRKASMGSFVLCALVLAGCGGGGGGGGSAGKVAIVANTEDNSVTFFNTGSLAVLGTAQLTGSWPWEITMSGDGSTAYVMNRDSNSVSIVSMSQMAEIGTILLSGVKPGKAALVGDYLYVTFHQSTFLSKVLVRGGTPAEAGTIGLDGSASGYSAIKATRDGAYLYVGARSASDVLSKVSVAAGAETASFASAGSYMYDMALDDDGKLYMAHYDLYEIPVWDTMSDTMGSSLPLGVDELAHDLALGDGKLYIANNTGYGGDTDGGALTIVDTDKSLAGYQYGQADEGYFALALPFAFPFLGAEYNTVYVTSNGTAVFDESDSGDYETDVGNINGFGFNMEDLDSGSYNIYNYSARAFSDHAVLQWCTATYLNSTSTDSASVFELVMNDDGSARMDYLLSGPLAILAEGILGFEYGVGDGSGTAVANLRPTYGSPFAFERKSFVWDSTAETLTPTAFAWEGAGAVHLPVPFMPHGIAMTADRVFLPCSNDGYSSANAVNVVYIYDRRTLLPAGTVTVGYGPRAIAIQP